MNAQPADGFAMREAFALSQVARAAAGPWSSGTAVCFVCMRDRGNCRYGISREWFDGDVLHGEALLDESHEGGPQVAHGGAIAALLDEIMGNYVLSRGNLSVTKSLTVDFRRPVPIGRPVRLSARLHGRDGDRWSLAGAVLASGGGQVLASGHGVWVVRGAEHWRRARIESTGPPPGQPGR